MFVSKAIFVERDVIQNNRKKKKKSNFLRRSKKSHFFWKKKRISKNKFEKWWKNSFSVQMSNNRNSENIFLEGFKQVFLVSKKKVSLSCLKEQDWKKKEKEWNKKTVIEQKKFYKKGWTNEKSFVFRENKGD